MHFKFCKIGLARSPTLQYNDNYKLPYAVHIAAIVYTWFSLHRNKNWPKEKTAHDGN